MAKGSDLTILDISGGIDETESPHLLPDNKCVQAENVEFFFSSLGERRLGCESVNLSGSGLDSENIIVHLGTHLPSLERFVDTQLFAVGCTRDISVTIAHRANGIWSAITPVDAILPTTPDVLRIKSASVHNKWFVAYKSAVNRMHVWDGTRLRPCGVGQPATPAVANSGTGALTGDRIYRVRFVVKDSENTVILRSNPTDEVAWTPNGVSSGVLIFRPDLIGEGETHWEIEGSNGDGNFYVLATIEIATTSYIDTVADPLNFADGTLSEDAGDYDLIPSARFVVVDQDRVIFGGSYEDPEKDSRISWTPVWGAPGVGNDERIPVSTDNFEDLDWMVGGGLTGVSDPINGSFYVFKHSRIYKLQRTGQLTGAYAAFLLSATRGALEGSVVNGVDEYGRGCVYFLDPQAGPARVSSGGLQFMTGLRTTWLTVNSDADMVVSHGVYYPDKQQVHWWLATQYSHSPNLKIISQITEIRSSEDGTTGGWTTANGTIATAWCSCVLPELVQDLSTGSAIISFRPYGGFQTPNFIQRLDVGQDDNGNKYRAVIKTKPYIMGGLLNKWGGMASALMATSVTDPSVEINIKMIRDFGVESTQITTNFLPLKSEDIVIKRFDDSRMSDATAIQIEFSDPPLVSDNC